MITIAKLAPLLVGAVLCLPACTPNPDAVGSRGPGRQTVARGAARSACSMITKEEMEALTEAKFGAVEDNDEKGQTSSSCNYQPPEGALLAPRVSINIDWGESDVDAKAGFAGAKAGGSIGKSMTGGMGAMPSGPVEGLGDEANIAMNVLTVRKGAVLILIQASLIDDPMKMVMDSTANADQFEKAKRIARAVLAKL